MISRSVDLNSSAAEFGAGIMQAIADVWTMAGRFEIGMRRRARAASSRMQTEDREPRCSGLEESSHQFFDCRWRIEGGGLNLSGRGRPRTVSRTATGDINGCLTRALDAIPAYIVSAAAALTNFSKIGRLVSRECLLAWSASFQVLCGLSSAFEGYRWNLLLLRKAASVQLSMLASGRSAAFLWPRIPTPNDGYDLVTWRTNAITNPDMPAPAIRSTT